MGRRVHTGCLLLTIPSDGANDGVLLSADTVGRTVDVSLGLSSLVLGLAGSVLLLARVGPRLGACRVAHSLDSGSLEGVELPGGFAIRRERQRPRL